MVDEILISLSDQLSGGKTPVVYCLKGSVLSLISRHGSVLIVDSGFNKFPIKETETEKIMLTPETLIEKIKEVDMNRNTGYFPATLVEGLTKDKPWEDEFLKLLKKSDIREATKKKILKEYKNR